MLIQYEMHVFGTWPWTPPISVLFGSETLGWLTVKMWDDMRAKTESSWSVIIPSLTVLNKNMQFSSLRTNLVTDQCLNITENINIKNEEVEGVNILMKAFVLKDNRGRGC